MNETKKTSFWDWTVGNLGVPYAFFFLYKSGMLKELRKQFGNAFAHAQSVYTDLHLAYQKKAGRWIQVVSGIFGAIFLLVTAFMLGFWNRQADGFAPYQMTLLLSALFGFGFIGYAVWVQGAVPEYAVDDEGNLIPDEETESFKLSPSKKHRFNRISTIGLLVAIVVTNIVMFISFMAIGYFQRSIVMTVFSLPFLAIAFGLLILAEKLIKFVAFQMTHIVKIFGTEGIDFATVALPGKLMRDYWAHREAREAKGEKATPTNSDASLYVIAPLLLAAFVQMFLVVSHQAWVSWLHLCIVGMTLVALIGIALGEKEVVQSQKKFWARNFVRFGMATICVITFVGTNWHYAGYACGLFIPPSEGWKVAVLDVVLVGLGIFLFLVGSKAIKEMRKFTYVMWTAAAICFVLGVGSFVSALADGGATTQACYDGVKARAGEKTVDSSKDSKTIVVTAPTTTATASASVSAPPPVKDEATKLAEATVNEIKKARTEIQDSLVEGKKLLGDLKQVSSDRAEGKPTVVALTASEKKATAKTSSAPTSSPKSSSASTVAIVDSDAEVEAARKRLAAKYLSE